MHRICTIFQLLVSLELFQKNYLRNKSNGVLIAMTTSSGKCVPQRPWPWAPPFKGKIVRALQAQPRPLAQRHPEPRSCTEAALGTSFRTQGVRLGELYGWAESRCGHTPAIQETNLQESSRSPPPCPTYKLEIVCLLFEGVLGFSTEDKWNWSHGL